MVCLDEEGAELLQEEAGPFPSRHHPTSRSSTGLSPSRGHQKETSRSMHYMIQLQSIKYYGPWGVDLHGRLALSNG